MLGFYVNDIAERLAALQDNDGWQVSLYGLFVTRHVQRNVSPGD